MKAYVCKVLILFTLALIANAQQGNAAVDQLGGEAVLTESPLTKGGLQATNGFLSFSHPIFKLAGGNGLSVTVALNYSTAGIRDVVGMHNDIVATGVVGLGWRFGLEYIAVNHKGTLNYHDDEWVYIDANGGAHKISMNSILDNGIIQGLLNYKISAMRRGDIIYAWEIIAPDGTRRQFGDYDNSYGTNALSVTYFNGPVVGLMGVGTSSANVFYDAWYLARIVHQNKNNSISYEYFNREAEDYITGEPIGVNGVKLAGVVATKAVYLKRIYSGMGGQIKFIYGTKEAYEYYDPTPVPAYSGPIRHLILI